MYASDLESKIMSLTKESGNSEKLIKDIEKGITIRNITEARVIISELVGHLKSRGVEIK